MGAFAHTASHFTTLALDVRFQFIAIFIMMYISRNYECQTITLRTFFYRLLLLDDEMWKEVRYMSSIVCIMEPVDELSTFSGPMPSMSAKSSPNKLVLFWAISINSSNG